MMSPGTPQQTGFTLIEIMVALALGLVLTAGAAYLFISNKQTYRMAEAVARIQENGRYALETVAADLRMAGHLSCVPDPARVDIVSTDSSLSGADPLPRPVGFDADDGELTIRYADARQMPLAQSMGAPSADVQLRGNFPVEAQDEVLITDCSAADLFTVTERNANQVTTGGQTATHLALSHDPTDSDGNAANTSGDLSQSYSDDAATRAMRFLTWQYRVDPDAGENAFGDPIGELQRRSCPACGWQTLLHGVESMQARFGECTGADQIRYTDASGVVDWGHVSVVRIGFLMHSAERVLDQPDSQTHTVAGVDTVPAGSGGPNPTHAGDPRLRQVFSTTVSLRNAQEGNC